MKTSKATPESGQGRTVPYPEGEWTAHKEKEKQTLRNRGSLHQNMLSGV